MSVTLGGMTGAEVRLEQLRKVYDMSVTLVAFDMSGGEVSFEQPLKVSYIVVTEFGITGASARLEQLRKVPDMLVTELGITGASVRLKQR